MKRLDLFMTITVYKPVEDRWEIWFMNQLFYLGYLPL